MPGKEEARIIIQNIEEKLNALYPDHPEVNFSNDPQLKRTQQVMSSSPSLKDIESRISEYETMQKYIQENYSEDIPGHEKNSMAGQNDFAYSDIKFILDDGIGGTINHLKETAEFIKEKDMFMIPLPVYTRSRVNLKTKKHWPHP